MLMTRRSLQSVVRTVARLLFIAAMIGAIVGISVAVALSPLLVQSFYGAGRDWTQQANVGQAYGAASAVLAALALGAVCVSLAMQMRQFRQLQGAMQRERTREIVKLALDEPSFAQCWGARFAPPHVDERLFFYTNFIVLNWSYAWERRLLTEPQARQFAEMFFDSEVPRMFWERYSDDHYPRLTLTRSQRFVSLMNEEYLRAIKRGPPSRLLTPMSDQSPSCF